MESLVVSLATAQKLKAAGYSQSPMLWYWQGDNLVYNFNGNASGRDGFIAAPTAQEIADQLSIEVRLYRQHRMWTAIATQVMVATEHDRVRMEAEGRNENMAEALAALYLKLQEEK